MSYLSFISQEEDGSLMIQMILGRRRRTTGGRRWANLSSDMSAMDAKYDYDYLIKYKGLSHLHVQWLSGTEIGTCADCLI